MRPAGHPFRRLSPPITLLLLFTTIVGASPVAAAAAPRAGNTARAEAPASSDTAIMFAADGMRQDIIRRYAGEGRLPTLGAMLENGARATGGGMQTQAPPNTGAGWYTMATGAWPAVHGSTNNTFFRQGDAFAGTRTAAFDAGVLQAETIAQAAERGGKKVAQIEWAGGRGGAIQGPTVDFRSFLSGRGVVTNYIGPNDDAAFVAAFGLQFDHPSGFSNQPPFPQAAPAPATGWTNVPPSDPAAPAMEMRMRVLDFGVDKYGLNAYIYDTIADGTAAYDHVLFSPTKDGSASVADLAEGEWADVKVTIADGPSVGLTAGLLVKVERLDTSLSQVRLFHTSVTRAIATWPTWPGEPGYTDFAEFLAAEFPTSTAGDFAVLEAGIVSEETYFEQAIYWETGHRPIIEYILDTYQPDLVLAGYPVTDEISHQFMGLVSPTLPNGDPNPAYDDVQVNGTPDGRVAEREAFIRRSYEGADATLALIKANMASDTPTFVGSDHGFAPQFLAIDASKVLVDLGLLSHPQTSNCRTATGETKNLAKACWAGGAVQIYLNVPAADYAATQAAVITAFQNLTDPNDWTGDGQPEAWRVIDRVYTKAEARFIPNGPQSTADMAHPTRTGDVVAFAYPPYQFDAATPGTLVSLSHFFGQHGYVPDVADRANNINMRATFLASGPGIKNKRATVASIDVAPTVAFLMRIPAPQHSQGRVLKEILTGTFNLRQVGIIGLNDFHGQLDPTTRPYDNAINATVGGAAFLKAWFDLEDEQIDKRPLILAAGDNVGASPPNSGLLNDRPAIQVENAWGMDATSYGNHEFDYGIGRLRNHQRRANFPFLAVNVVDEDTGKPPSWVRGTATFTVNGIRVGVIGAALENTPELVSAGVTEGLTFLPAGPAIEAASRKLERQGVDVQVVVIHEGTAAGSNAVDGIPAVPWTGPIMDIAAELTDTTIDAIQAGHTHRVSNTYVGDILITEGINAGASYSVINLMVSGGDVIWAGGTTRIAKTIGLTPDPDVQKIVDRANEQTAELRNQVIGEQVNDILRDPLRFSESEMGNLVADAMLAKYPGIDAALTNSGGLRADLVCSPPLAGEEDCEITWGEVFAVLPFGNRTTIADYTGAQLKSAGGFLNGFLPVCDGVTHSGRFPQVAGMVVEYHCNAAVPVIDGIWLGTPGGTLDEVLDTETVRLVTNDFMFTGGDGWTALTGGTDVLTPGDGLLEITIEYITANSPVDPVIEGRIVKDSAGG